jgi:hypothetical protein
MKVLNVVMVCLVAVAAPLAVGCGSSKDGSASSGSGGSAPAPQTHTQMINAKMGGTVSFEGASITIPAGALSADTNITVAVTDKAGQPNEANIGASIFELGPNGTTFAMPVALAIPMSTAVPTGKKAVVAFLQNGAWVPLADSTVSGSTVTAHTTHFTPYTVVFVDGMQTGGLCGSAFTACGGDLTGSWSINIGCANITPADAPVPNCQGSMISVTVDPTGIITFDPTAGTYAIKGFDATITYAGSFPASCAPGSNCSMEMVKNATVTANGSSCTLSGTSDINNPPGPMDEMGTLMVNGSQFTTQKAGSSSPGGANSYCVMGNTLYVQFTAGKNGSTILLTGTKQ